MGQWVYLCSKLKLFSCRRSKREYESATVV